MAWKIVPDDTFNFVVAFYDDKLDLEVYIKWDGCMEILTDDAEIIHICDPVTFIAQLQDVIDKARVYFDGEFGVAPLTNEERRKQIELFQKREAE